MQQVIRFLYAQKKMRAPYAYVLMQSFLVLELTTRVFSLLDGRAVYHISVF